MAKKRDLKLSDHNISKEKYLELKYFCLQYNEKKDMLEKNYGLHSVVHDGQPRGNRTGNPTEYQAMRNEMLKSDIELIEQTAIQADPEIYQYILKNVTEGIGYDYLDVPLCRTKFYDSRRYFFFLLSKKR